jgi:3-hydroxybutyryl-CoA dehydratase
MSHIRKKAIEGLKAGDSFSVTRTFTEQDVIMFGEISGDYNPVHYDERFAWVKKFKGRVCHGLLVAGMVTEIGGQIGWLASSMNLKFRQPVYIGDTITCTLSVVEAGEGGRARAEAVFLNQGGFKVMECTLTGIIPGASEQEVLTQMVAEGDPTNKRENKKEF